MGFVSQFLNIASLCLKSANETITGAWNFSTAPTLNTPVISNLSSMNHTHASAAQGGTVAHTSLSSIGTNTHAQIDTHITTAAAHIAASTAHGIVGAVVGTTDTQILSNKTFTGLTNGGEANFNWPSTFASVRDDFIGNSNNAGEITWSNQASGTSAAVANTSGELNHPGIRKISTGTQTTSYAGVLLRTTFNYPTGGDVIIWIIKLSSITEATIRVGLADFTTSADSVDGYYFEFDPAVSANWLMCCANSSTRTKTASSFPVVASTWYKTEIRVNSGNTSAEFFIDGVSIGTVASNLPSGASDLFGIGCFALNSGGASANVDVDVDLMHWYNKGLVR